MMIIFKLIAHLLLITNLSVGDECNFNALLTEIGVDKVCAPTRWDQSDENQLDDPLTWVNVGITLISAFEPTGAFGAALDLMSSFGVFGGDSFSAILQELFDEVLQCIDTKIAESRKTTVENEVIYAATSWYQMASDPNANYVGLPDLASLTSTTAVSNFGASSTNTLTITEAEVLLPSSKMLSDIYWLILTAELGSYKNEFYAERSASMGPNEWDLMYDITDIDLCNTYKSRIDTHLTSMGYLEDWIQTAIDLIAEIYKPTTLCLPFGINTFITNAKEAHITCGGECRSPSLITQQFNTWIDEEIEDNFIQRVESYMEQIAIADDIVCDGPVIDEPVNCICFTVYSPVCCDGTTYSNQCRAGCDGFSTCSSGTCSGDNFDFFDPIIIEI